MTEKSNHSKTPSKKATTSPKSGAKEKRTKRLLLKNQVTQNLEIAAQAAVNHYVESNPANPPGEVSQAFDDAQTALKQAARLLSGNVRIAKGYHDDRAKIRSFLLLLAQLAQEEQRKPGVSIAEEVVVVTTVQDLSTKSGLTAFEVDKFLRWACKGLGVVSCKIPKKKNDHVRTLTFDSRAVFDIDYLLNPARRIGIWDLPVEVATNEFKFKSLSNFRLNIAVGCFFGCLFCYVPSVSTINLGWRLVRYGVMDADSEWGSYCLFRRWDEEVYRSSLRKMLKIPASELPVDGHRAIMMSTDTDPYMPVFHPDPDVRRKLRLYVRAMVRRCLEILLEPEFADLKLRVQTRGLEVQADFDLLKQFGNRLVLGMSIPTLNNTLSKIYEPTAPAPTKRLEVLKQASEAGIPIFVSMAPTFPECDEADLRKTLTAFKELPLLTIFHESVNARSKNVDRILDEAKRRGMETMAEIIRKPTTRIPYAIAQMDMVARLVDELGLKGKLHHWPDVELMAESVITAQPDPELFRARLEAAHGRISEWPGQAAGYRDPYVTKPKEPKTKWVLNADERKILSKLIAAVKALGKASCEAGRSLRVIRDRKLHEPQTFDEFCRQQFGFSRQHAYRLIDFAALTDILSPIGDKNRLPTCESQVRPIMAAFRDSSEHQVKAWQAACAITPDSVPTAEDVEQAVSAMVGGDDKAKPKATEPRAEAVDTAQVFSTITKLKSLVTAGDTDACMRLIEGLEEQLRRVLGLSQYRSEFSGGLKDGENLQTQ